MSWIWVCGFDQVSKQELGHFRLILRIARWDAGFSEGVWSSDPVLGRQPCAPPTSGLLSPGAAGASRSLFPTPTFFPQFGVFLRNSANFNLILSARVDPDRPATVSDARGAAVGWIWGRIWGEALEDDLFAVWPDVLLQLCLGKCPWMVCCCHTSFNSVPSFY